MNSIRFGRMTAGIDYDALEATKAAIFKKVGGEKSDVATQNVQSAYSYELKNDIMATARESVRPTNGNPFSNNLENQSRFEAQKYDTESEQRIVGDNVPVFKKIGKFDNGLYKSAIQNETMTEARKQFDNNDRLTQLLTTLNGSVAVQSSVYKAANFEKIERRLNR